MSSRTCHRRLIIAISLALLLVAVGAVAAPTISSVSPNPATGSTSPQTITINGTNFVNKPTVTVTWTGGSKVLSSTEVAFISSTQLTMTITTLNDPDNWTVQVTNPSGGGSSSVFPFRVVAPTPVISSLSTSPSPPTAAGAFAFTIRSEERRVGNGFIHRGGHAYA